MFSTQNTVVKVAPAGGERMELIDREKLISVIEEDIQKAPSIQQKPRTGSWLSDYQKTHWDNYRPQPNYPDCKLT